MSKVFFFETFPAYLIIALPVFLITGPFLPDLSISIIAIIFLINSIQNNLSKYYNNIFVNFFLIFWIILICSSLLSENVLISLKSSFFILDLEFSLYVFGTYLRNKNF